MIRKNHKAIRMLSCAVIAALMAIGAAFPAFATDYSSGTGPDNPAKAAITKVFKMPVGTPTPAAEFVFTFDKTGMNDPMDASPAALNGMPAIPDAKINYTAGEEPTGGTFISGDVKSVVKESGNFLAGITPGMWVNGVGIYRYRVYETTASPGGSLIVIADPAKEGAAYSKAVYDVEIWVDEDDGHILYPKFVVVKTVTDYIDEYYQGTPGGEKVDPTPGGVNHNEETTIEDDFSQVVFTNKYWKTDGGGTTDPGSSALEIVKKVKGLNADPTVFFSFDVKVTQPSVIPERQTYKAFVLDKDGVNVTDTVNYSPLESDKSILFSSGVEIQGIKLRDGQRLVFVDLHIGASVEAKEAASNEYIPSYHRTFAGTNEYTGVVKEPFGFPRASEDPGPHYIAQGAKQNVATFTNTRTGATPTGISVDNLPYIVLIAAAVIGFACFVAVKYRRSTKIDSI